MYPDGKEELFLPGIPTTRFQLDFYKEELGKPYSQIVLYLRSTCEFDNFSCSAIKFNPNPKLSLPGIATNHFDKIYESEMPVVVDDQEQEPIPVNDLEKEVFDLDSYSYNQTLVTSNADTNFSSVTLLFQ